MIALCLQLEGEDKFKSTTWARQKHFSFNRDQCAVLNCVLSLSLPVKKAGKLCLLGKQGLGDDTRKTIFLLDLT